MYYPANSYYDQQYGDAAYADSQGYGPPVPWNSQWGPPQHQEYYYSAPHAYEMPAYNREVANSQWEHTAFAQARPAPAHYTLSQAPGSSELDLDGAPIVQDDSYHPPVVHRLHEAYSSSKSRSGAYRQSANEPRGYPSQSPTTSAPTKCHGQAAQTKTPSHGDTQSDKHRIQGDSSIKNPTEEKQASPTKSPGKRKRTSSAQRYIKKQPDWYTPPNKVKMPIEYEDLTESDSELSSISDQSAPPSASLQSPQNVSTAPKQADGQPVQSAAASTPAEPNKPTNSGVGKQIGKNAAKDGDRPGGSLSNATRVNVILAAHYNTLAAMAEAQMKIPSSTRSNRKRKRKRNRSGPTANAKRRERRERREWEKQHQVETVANALQQTPNNFGKGVEQTVPKQPKKVSSTNNLTIRPTVNLQAKVSANKVSAPANDRKSNSSSQVQVPGSQTVKQQTPNQAGVPRSQTVRQQGSNQAGVPGSPTVRQQTPNQAGVPGSPAVRQQTPNQAGVPGSQTIRQQSSNQAGVPGSQAVRQQTSKQAEVRKTQTDKQQTLDEQPQVVLHVPNDSKPPSTDDSGLPVSRSKNARKRKQYQMKMKARAQLLQIKAGKDVELDAMKNDLELY